MKRPQMTPGPWQISSNRGERIDRIKDSDFANIAFVPDGEHERKQEEANARAIAVLPNLLDTLEACLQSLEDCWKLTNGECGGTRDIGTRNLIGEKIDWIKNALRLAGYEF